MREILFRGKRIDNGEWCIGFYCQVADESDGGARVKHVIVVPTFMTQKGFLAYEVDPSTVGQYTGLTNKNGKKIFEGDIVATPNYRGVVDYGIGCYCVRHGIDDPAIDIVMNDFDVYVIDNIHDNPELLEVGE